MPRSLAISIALLISALSGAGIAHGELSQSEGLRVDFNGGFSPSTLPRDRLVPVSVRMEGSFGTVNGRQPPQLMQISFAINRNGKLFSGGLPTCAAGLLQSTTSRTALTLCRPALIGRGSFSANLNFPGFPQVPVLGRLLAFNGRSEGQAEILLHLYVSSPAQVTLVVPFKVVRQSAGAFGTILSARIPKIAGEIGDVTNISLEIGRRYRFRGRPRSLLSASCAAPPGFPGAIFNFAKGTFYFANGQRLTTTLTRACQVG